jgi:hypothetical protein
MTSWVPYWDDSFDQVTDLASAYKAGYRVMAGYVAGGSSSKWSSAARIQAWFAQGPDTGFFPLFEGNGTEPIDSPSLGDNHAATARAAARARNIPDSVSISPAVDTNINQAQWTHEVAQYFSLWKGADTVPPVPYVEADAGSYLKSQGISCGTFTPAAYAWNVPAVLYTPSNAPSHVVCTQEHNGKKMFGGTADIGHIRTDAPCVWWNPEGQNMDLTDDNLNDIADRVWARANITNPPNYSNPGTKISPAGAVSSIMNYNYEDTLHGRSTQQDLDALTAEVTAQGAKIDQILALLQAGSGGTTTTGHFNVTGTLDVTEAPTQ